MNCKYCGSIKVIRGGTRDNKQKWICKSCGKQFTYGEKRKKQERPLIFNYSLGYVLGVLAGDASISRWKDYYYFNEKNQHVRKCKATRIVPRFRYGFQLQCKDKDFAETFAEHLRRVTGKKATMYPIQSKLVTVIAGNILRKPYVFHGFKVQSISKEWHDKVIPLMVDNFSWIERMEQKVKIGFLKGFYDSEGGIGIERGVHTARVTIYLTNKNRKLLLLAKTFLNDMGINSYIVDRPEISRLRIRAKHEVSKFYKAVGFSLERKMKKIGELLAT